LATAIAGALIMLGLVLTPWNNLSRQDVAPAPTPTAAPAAAVIPATPETASKPAVTLASLQSKDAYNGLPVANVKYYPVDGAQGTVILLPQYHRDPTTTDIYSASNDSGVRNQQQTAQIMKYLVDDGHVNLVMVEGDLQGDVPQSKIDHTKAEMAARDQFAQSIKDLQQALDNNHLNPAMEQQLMGQLNQELDKVNRDIWLQSAPYVLKAQGENLSLIGSENQQNLDKATAVVRNYVYINDRLAQVSQRTASPQLGMGGQPVGNPLSMGGNPLSGINAQGIQQLLQMLGMGNGQGNVAQGLSALQSMAQSKGDSQLVSVLTQTQQAYQNLESSTKTATAVTSGPSRADNPYANISDPVKLQQMLKESEQQINDVVINQRNQEAASSLAQAMKDRGQDVAMLQFGAGHEDTLVPTLNAQKLNVIVITTNEVASRAGQEA